jgi:hypothetical protein
MRVVVAHGQIINSQAKLLREADGFAGDRILVRAQGPAGFQDEVEWAAACQRSQRFSFSNREFATVEERGCGWEKRVLVHEGGLYTCFSDSHFCGFLLLRRGINQLPEVHLGASNTSPRLDLTAE